MSRLAMDQITITDVTDGEKGVSVKIVTPLYALGTTAPDKPTVNPPESIWTTTEPEYVKGKNLYTTQRTVLEDSTFSYSDVSLDSSYKASEQAITTADTANTTAGEAKTTAGEAKTTAGEAKTTSTEAKTIATEAKTASTTNKNNLDSEIKVRNQAIENLKTSVNKDVEVVSQKAADAQKAGDTASADLSKFRTSTESQLNSINGLVGGVRTDVDAVSKKAATLESGIDSANTKITDTSDKLNGLTTTVSNVSKTADDSMALSTTNHQDLTGFKTTVQQTYSTKEDTLSQVNTVTQKADAISATLSKDYQKTADSDAKYSTKAELTATSKSITASVAEIYATKSVVDALKNIADKAIETWQGPGEPTLTNLPASDWTTADLKKQHSGDVYYDTDSGFAYRFGSADGIIYKWGRISDSDITKALNLASKAQETADGAVAGVTKLNTDIPLTYATKSEVKVTTDGIKADVVEAKRIGQTGVDNAASLAIRANGIDATLSQQTSNIDKNVKSITQLSLRADGINTSISQVSTKTDLALANAQNMVMNTGNDLTNTWGNHGVTAENGVYTRTFPGNENHVDFLLGNLSGKAIPGHTYSISLDARVDSGNYVSDDGFAFGWSDGWYSVVAKSLSGDWQRFAGKTTVGGNGHDAPTFFMSSYMNSDGAKVVQFRNLSIKDITEAAAAQGTADTALSQVSTLSQDLTGFKTQVTQTYETKDASTAKAATAQQNLDGFKNIVHNDYLSKTDAGTTYSTKTETTQTAEDLTTKITNVGKDATSALTRITTAEQDVSGFKNTVSSTYATKAALDTTNGNVTQAQATGDQAIFAALPSLADKTQANSWLCAIFPAGNGSVQSLPSYSLIASLAASDTKYNADSGDILTGQGVNYSYGLIRTLVSFNAATTWKFTYSHDDGSRIYVDGVLVFEKAAYTQNDSVTINFTKGNHIVDVMYSNGWGDYGIWGFSVALSSIATTMYAPAGASVLATALDKAQKDATSALSQYTTLSQDVNGFKQTVDQKYETKEDSQSKNSTLSQSLTDFKTSVSQTYETKTDSANKQTTLQQNLDGFKTSVSQTYATKQALSDTDGKAVTAGNNANLAIANALECVLNGDFANGTANWGLGSNRDIVNVSGRGNVLHAVLYNTNSVQGIFQNDVGQRLGYSSKARVIKVGWDYLINSRSISGDADWRITIRDTPYENWIGERGIPLKTPALGQWLHYETTYNIPANNTIDQFWFISRNLSSGDAADLYLDNISVKDITEVAQLQSDVAATYATQSSVQQTATQITSQVETKYATKDDVSSKYTKLQQTDSAFDTRIGTAQSTAANAQSNASNAQNRIGTMETLVHTDANGVRVGKQKNGAWSGYSVLMNANGSFDVLDPGGGVDARVNTDGLSVMDNTTNKLRLINRSVFNTDPIYMTSSGEWHGNGHHTHNVTWLVDGFNADLGDIRIQFDTNFSSAIRVDLGAYIAQAAGNYGNANGSVSTIRGWCFQIWEKKPDGTNVLFQDTQPSKALKAINAVWQQGTQTISGGTFSASFLVTGLKQYATYYLETRHAGSFYSPREDNGYWCDWDCVNPWACVTPLS